MDKSEALKTINEIQGLLKANNRAFTSPKAMAGIGVGILAIIVIEFLIATTHFDSFLYDNFGPWANGSIRLLYGVMFYLLIRFFSDGGSGEVHPLIIKAFSIEKFFLTSIFVIIFSLMYSKHYLLIYPSILILSGLFYNLLGKFINKSFSLVSWFWLFLGGLGFLLANGEQGIQWEIYALLQSLSLFFIAFYTSKYDRAK